ncbi:hypothetical protein HMN09_01262300 [Mycena chlorophos]|uniref:Uncharacterized protein n=1 Tax=Mycena chlorophos TaxID=658473 RepID=A0A8H6VRV0_MYCCL|nr:hypothetical protein HMN09_01262300 [Mycena chlorophos]
MGDLAFALAALPFDMPRLRSLARIDAAYCDELLLELRSRARDWIRKSIDGAVLVPLLHGRLEPQKKGPGKKVAVCRRHYLSRVAIADHRLALTRLLCGSFHFRALRTDPDAHRRVDLLCRKCGSDFETPGHVFMRCRAAETVGARDELRETLQEQWGIALPVLHSREEAESAMRTLIGHNDAVVPMARFVYRVVKSWKFFGRRLPTMVCELVPDSEEELDWEVERDFESATEDGSDGGGEMDIDF